MKKVLYLSVILFVLLSGMGCKKDKSDSGLDLEIRQFIWYGMNTYYLWTDNVSNLDDSYLYNETALNSFISDYPDKSSLFEALCYRRGVIDRFSWIVEDYEELEKQLSGVTKSMGFDFTLGYWKDGSDKLIGVVLSVIPNSPADLAGIKRGDWFCKIDGQQLTVSNYQTLLYDNAEYSFTYVSSVNQQEIVAGNTTKVMTAVEVQENPIALDSVYEVSGKKIGYLIYTGFYSEFDNELNNVFGKFKTSGIDELIVDLRYNLGGAVTSAVDLASMIYSTDGTKLLSKEVYNNELSNYFLSKYGADFFNTYFTNKLLATTANIPVNCLNMSKVYFLTSDHTASASEMVINNLRPYIDVRVIGDTTYGKYVASTTIKDYDSTGTVNPRHKWAMQPIIAKYSNVEGVTDFYNGLNPSKYVEENVWDLKQFGDLNDPILATAISDITGTITKKASIPKYYRELSFSKLKRPHSTELYINTQKFQKKLKAYLLQKK